ncbi:hypothetical protein KJ707_04350 [Patescibacteria group bacterium]|nr:hypothetical protein [Patescibacteria group bacterium]MBU1967413.1 hypothetical protein [Patescibacteria group bacterium]MBU2543763.1 hypothetical protein [Patescibacteria group bacterium]
MKKQLWLELGVICFLSLVVFLFGLNKINLTTADIGRHLTNGKLFVQQKTLVSTNHYSYTMQDKLVTNHHWLSGVIFYFIFQLAGFNGLSVFYACLLAMAFTIFFLIGKHRSSWWPLILTTVLSLPLIGLRAEVRPEVFSLVFLGLEIWLLLIIVEKKQFRWWVWLIFGLIQILWVNLHLFFFLSWGVVGAMLVAQLVLKNKPAIIFLAKLLGVVFLTSFASPFGYKSAIEPFYILQNFGYQLAESQTLPFMIKRFGTLEYWHGLAAMVLGLGAGGYLLWRHRAKQLFAVLLIITFSIFAFVMNRFVPILGLMLVGFGSWAVGELLRKKEVLEKSLIPFLSVFLLLIFISQTNSYLSPFGSRSGMGLLPAVESSAEFFKQHNLFGPIFNNYDIGGFLINQLFPTQRVFVDNRPEAYSPEFFKEYIAAQEDEPTWQKLDQVYNFATIFFYRHDFTPWAQPFLIKRIQDKAWVGVYVDDYVLILVKDDQRNQEVIEKFRLPSETFLIN